MHFNKTLPILISILVVAVLTQYSVIAGQPEYLEDKEHPRRSMESILRRKMEEVRGEIDRLNKKLKENISHLHELEKELRRVPIEKRIQDLKKSLADAKNKLEDLKREHAPEEKIRRVVRQIEVWKRELEEVLHRPEHEFPQAKSQIMIIRLEHAPADHIAELVEGFLTHEGLVKADMRTNSLIIREVEPNLQDLERIIHELDQPGGPHPAEAEMEIPGHSRELADVLDITEEFVLVSFPEHWNWQEAELWIPRHQTEDGEWVRDERITEKVSQLGIGTPIEVEWERHEGDERFWIVEVEPLGTEIPLEEMQKLMHHALEATSPEEALARFNNVLEHDPECRTVYGKAAQIMVGVNLMKLGKLKEAEEAINIGLELFPEEDRSLWKLRGYEALGHVYHERENLEKVIGMYRRAMELYSPEGLRGREVDIHPIIVHHKAVRIKLSQIYIQTGQKELAIKTLKSVFGLERRIPRLDARAHLLIGKLQMESDNLEAAKTELQEVLDLAKIPEAEVNEDVVEQAKENLKKIKKND